MPFGLPVWACLWAMASALLLASLLVGNRWATRTSAVILGSYVLVRAVYATPISSELQILSVAALWVVASCLVPLRGAADELKPLVVRAMMACSGSYYLWARITDAPRVFGSMPYVLSDVFLIAAMMLIGWTLGHDIRRAVGDFARGWLMGGRHSSSGTGHIHPFHRAKAPSSKEVE